MPLCTEGSICRVSKPQSLVLDLMYSLRDWIPLHMQVLCEGLPPQFAKFIRIARTLPFEIEPDYAAYRKLFQDCLIEEGKDSWPLGDAPYITLPMLCICQKFTLKSTCAWKCAGFGRDYIFDWTVIHHAMAGVPRTFVCGTTKLPWIKHVFFVNTFLW
jgi:hypothetical protein